MVRTKLFIAVVVAPGLTFLGISFAVQPGAGASTEPDGKAFGGEGRGRRTGCGEALGIKVDRHPPVGNLDDAGRRASAGVLGIAVIRLIGRFRRPCDADLELVGEWLSSRDFQHEP